MRGFLLLFGAVLVMGGCRTRDPNLECTSLLGRPLRSITDGDSYARSQAHLAEAEQAYAADPTDPDRIIWLGRRLGYLWRMQDAIEIYTVGLRQHPDYAPLYRHRGHRYISVREFDRAVEDLRRAAELIAGAPDEIEPDGMPNAQNIPLTTTGFNVWYHLALAHYLRGEFEEALSCWGTTMAHTRGIPDNIAAVTDWTYLTLRRLDRHEEADAVLAAVSPEWEMIENHAYHRRLMMYKGLLSPGDLLDVESATDLDLATLGYGLAAYHLANGDSERAWDIMRRVTSGPYWPAFGFIAAEADLARARRR